MIYFTRSLIRKGEITERIENFCRDSISNRYLKLPSGVSNSHRDFYLDSNSGVDKSVYRLNSTEYFCIREWEF